MSRTYESLTGALDASFPEYADPPPEPMALVRNWISAAVEGKVREPLALALATADDRGRASNRTVTVVEVAGEGLVFTSHSTSQKGREIAQTGWASGLLYWREVARQLIVSGPVTLLSAAEADRLWAARPAPLHAMTTASWQSDPLDDVSVLRAEADRLSMRGGPLPRPERFAGYRLEPAVVEFWSAASGRLHRRLRYDRAQATWRSIRLQP
ncbi:phenazine biosynthesis FMN-dependent oxidase PhzG [Actinomadura sp. 7K507]|uniref:phenazine biosynthesis FMN-dependent oxidase PhzG n=1 Tax=Actinomadura sp. 7K507 TaxID=2530365 RepID=UPI00104A8C27|nr:phenazine biosynthesis FMN-dependent oxidase PhzG [Actinomadura sp. 7K507]TDC98389.1 pyridoxal 5'-phosphate synthase [Actinomadura sp. 7K507]